MANILKLKRSAVARKVPGAADLTLGELALNTWDGRLFGKKNDGADAIVEFFDGGNPDIIDPAAILTYKMIMGMHHGVEMA